MSNSHDKQCRQGSVVANLYRAINRQRTSAVTNRSTVCI